MKSRVQAWIHVALGAFLALAVLGGWEVASIASAASPTLISGCYTTPSGGRGDDRGRGDESTGALRIVRSSSDCRRGETFIQWNQAGQPGPAGVSGPAGPQGPAGALPNVSCMLPAWPTSTQLARPMSPGIRTGCQIGRAHV